MTEYSFYQLLRTPLEAALPRILEKVRELDLRAVVV
ncbi:MAG: DNA polymerase III subunit chi, partial [Alphaproteobacteria bacterium]|nr:DNA polymerase III subunit chi [Alphaproteobacteria bacterium]